jgi:hypothetical protein
MPIGNPRWLPPQVIVLTQNHMGKIGITINIKSTKFVKDLPMIDAQFRFNQCNSFKEEYISVFSPYGPVLILHRCQPLFGPLQEIFISIDSKLKHRIHL